MAWGNSLTNKKTDYSSCTFILDFLGCITKSDTSSYYVINENNFLTLTVRAID